MRGKPKRSHKQFVTMLISIVLFDIILLTAVLYKPAPQIVITDINKSLTNR